MKLTWNNKNKNNSKKRPFSVISNLPFEIQREAEEEEEDIKANHPERKPDDELVIQKEDENETSDSSFSDIKKLYQSYQAQGDKLAEDGKFREALGKWETALNLMPENAVLHEQKAQVLLEIGEAWGALKAATRATDIDPSWAEMNMRKLFVIDSAWITLGRAQLNFGEPDSAIESFDKALAIKPDSGEARDDRRTALDLIKRRKQFHSAGLNSSKNRYVVGDKLKDVDNL